MVNETFRDNTDFLKGIVILSVLISHYINRFFPDFPIKGYANGLISIFFILSGYGIFYSLEKYKGNFNFNNVFNFYKNRFLRIYILLFVTLIMSYFFFGNKTDFWTISGIYTKNRWVVTSIIQCYLVSLPLYLLLKKLKTKKFIFLMLVITILANIILNPYVGFFKSIGMNSNFYAYRNIFLSNIFLFSIGLVLPEKIKDYHKKIPKKVKIISIAISLICIIYYSFTPAKYKIIPIDPKISTIIFFISLSIFLYFIIAINIKLYFKRFFIILGIYSYSLYLFHTIYYGLLDKVGVAVKGSLEGLIATIILFPIFLIVCIVIEKIINLLIKRDQIFFKTKLGWPRGNSLVK